MTKKQKKDSTNKISFDVLNKSDDAMFVKASEIDEMPKKGEDFSFILKNKVRFNCVDLVVNEYQQDPEELEA